jgi:heme-degrading monooxygenase HmoA
MFLMIREYRVPAGQVEEVARRVDDDWLDRIRVLPGFLSYHVVRTGEDQLVSLAAFIDEAHGQRGAEASAEWVGERLSDLDVEFVQMRQGPVLVHGGE